MDCNIVSNAACNNIFSHSLMTFYDEANYHIVINNILKDVLNLYNADRSYIFLYDLENKVQKYSYEICAENVSPQIEIIKEIPLDNSPFINNILFNYSSFIVNDIDNVNDLPEIEYEILKSQDIKSLILTPITHMNKILGYMGVDIVKEYRNWSDQDTTLIFLLGQIVGASVARNKENEKELSTTHGNNIIRALESIYNDIPIGIELYNSSGCAIDLNNTDMKIFGIEDKWKVMGLSIFDNPLFPDQYKDLLRQGKGFDLIFDYDFSKTTEYFKSNYKEEIKYINCKAHIIKDKNDKTLYFILFNSDITSLREMQQNLIISKNKAEEADKLKMAFLANMSHEIRTPLNAIVGFSDILLHTDAQDEKEEYSKIISTNSELLLNLINDILDLSKIETGALDYNEELIDLNTLFEEFETSFKLRLSKKINLILRIPANKYRIHFDKKITSQLLNNFLSNAVKYTIEGEIEFGYYIQDNGIKIFVRDTGIGISEENKKKIFNRFEKVDNFAQGTGLGLSICKAIIDIINGEIGFESELNKGSYFWVWIPCKIES